MKSKITVILMVAVLFIATGANAQENIREKRVERAREMMHKKGMNPGEQHMNLFTAEQKEAMKKLRLEAAKQVKPLKNELRELMAHQQTLVTADKADLKAIEKNIDKISGVKAEMAKIMAKQHQEIRAQLSEEQLLKFDSMREMHMKKGGKHMDKRDFQRKGRPMPGAGA